MTTAIKRHARAIGESATGDGYGFSIELVALVAEYAIPALLKCWRENHSTGVESDQVSLKEFAEEEWVPHKNQYSRWVLRHMRPETQRAAIQAGGETGSQQAFTVEELDAMSFRMLDRARLEDVSDCLKEVAVIDLNPESES